MADRRMFNKRLLGSEALLNMPAITQLLYVHLNMEADDDGFVEGPNKIQRMLGASEEDLNTLADKGLIITFDSGIIAITHWRVNNYLRIDRYKPTAFVKEAGTLRIKDDGTYTIHEEGRPLATESTTVNKTRKGKKKESSKENMEEVNAYFEEQWQKLPRKEGKSTVSDTAKKKFFAVDHNKMDEAIKRYNAKMATRDEKYISQACKFVRTLYEDYLPDDAPVPDSKKAEVVIDGKVYEE